MDAPQHQVFREGSSSYRYMAFPLEKQPLHYLYPGRYMEQDYHFTGDNIANEDFPGAVETQQITAALAKAAATEREALARHLGGHPKLARHPPVEPEATLEDPQLRALSVDLRGDSEDLERVPSLTDNLRATQKMDHAAVADIRRQLGSSSEFAGINEIKPYRYDWRMKEGFEHSHPKACASSGTKSNLDMIMIGVIFAVLLLAILSVLCFRK